MIHQPSVPKKVATTPRNVQNHAKPRPSSCCFASAMASSEKKPVIATPKQTTANTAEMITVIFIESFKPSRLSVRPSVARDFAREHRGEEDEDRQGERHQRRDRGPRAEAREPPADAEERRARDQPPVEVAPCRHGEPICKQWMRTLEHQAEPRDRDRKRAAHDEEQRRVPFPGHVEKADDLSGVHHLRDGQPEAEQDSRREGREQLLRGGAHGCTTRWRTTYTVAIAVAMNTIVATIERFEPRAMPHTPWPLVQPPPMRVPKPTRNPATTINGIDPWIATANGAPFARMSAIAPIHSPTMNISRHAASENVGSSSPATMPLMPAMRPFASSKSTAATPISTPPKRPL